MEGVHPLRASEDEQVPNEIEHCQSDTEPSNPSPDGQNDRSDQVKSKQVPELSTNRFECGWGWGTWLPSSTAIQEAAAGAFRDVQELRQSLQEVLSADDKETGSDTEPAITAQQNSPKEPLSSDCRAVLDRLEGKENPLAAGLKVVDDHVGLLAEGVAGLAGTLWGGARTTSTHVAGQVETSLKHFGQSAIQLLDGGLDLDRQPPNSHPAADAPLTFATCFQGCGGLERCEELEELSSESARCCNRLRADLSPAACQRMDEELAALAPLFELKEGEEKSCIDERGENDLPVAKGHAMIAEFCNKATRRAQKLRQGGTATHADLAAIQSGAVLALARLVVLYVERLLNLGQSLAAFSRNRRPAEDHIQWSLQSLSSAVLLRNQVLRMILAIEELAQANSAILAEAASEVQTKRADQPADSVNIADNSARSGLQDQAEPSQSAVSALHEAPGSILIKNQQSQEDAHPETDADKKVEHEEADSRQDEPEAAVLLSAQATLAECCSAAKARVFEGFHKLIYVVLLASQESFPDPGE
ncbi:g11660 [Coccomyxa elongata]